MRENWVNNAIVGHRVVLLRSGGILAAFVIALLMSSQARADAISSAVLNYNGPLWAAFYNASDISGFNPATSVGLTINENPDIDVEDPQGNDWDGVFQLHINFTGGVPTSGTLVEQVDYSVDQDGSDLNPVYSSSVIREFGVIPSTSNYWFAFQNGSNPNDIIGGYIVNPGSDVKTFEIVVPEPSSVAVLALVGIVGGMGRFSRRFQHPQV